MFSSREAFENDFCPVRDELLGEMYRANEHGLTKLVESVSADVRAMLALFCYRRSHLHSLALAVAASCSERDLIQLGGRVGSALYALSREPAGRLFAVSLRSPQAHHAIDQAAQHGLADRGRTGRRCCRGRAGLKLSPTAAVRAASAPCCIRRRRACRSGTLRAALHRCRTTSPHRSCRSAPNSVHRRSACRTAVH